MALVLERGSWRWAELETPAATGLPVYLSSVSCSSAGNCSAVGAYTTASGAQQGLVLTESSGRWARGTKAVVPVGAFAVYLSSASCSSARDCTAVGSYITASGTQQGLVLTESSGRWARGTRAVVPVGAFAVYLSSVSCSSAGDCTAVGSYTTASGGQQEGTRQGLVLTESSGHWAPGTKAAVPMGPRQCR